MLSSPSPARARSPPLSASPTHPHGALCFHVAAETQRAGCTGRRRPLQKHRGGPPAPHTGRAAPRVSSGLRTTDAAGSRPRLPPPLRPPLRRRKALGSRATIARRHGPGRVAAPRSLTADIFCSRPQCPAAPGPAPLTHGWKGGGGAVAATPAAPCASSHPTRCCRSPAPRAPPTAGRPPPTAARSYRDTPALRGMLASLAVGEGRRGHFRTEACCSWSRSFLLLELAQERAEHGGLLKTWHHGLCLYEKVSEVTQVKGMRTTWFLVWWIETTTSPRQSCSYGELFQFLSFPRTAQKKEFSASVSPLSHLHGKTKGLQK